MMMANLTATPSFDGVYQIESTDPVLGGPPTVGATNKAGLVNWPAQALANRTAWLQQPANQVIRTITDAGLTYAGNTVTQLTTAINNLITLGNKVFSGNVDVQGTLSQGGICVARQDWSRTAVLGDTIRGEMPRYVNSTTVHMPRRTQCLDASRTALITAGTTTLGVDINIATNGLNGLDTGTRAANKVYQIFLVFNPTTGAGGYVASDSLTAPNLSHATLAGFTQWRRLDCWIWTRTDNNNVQETRQQRRGGVTSVLLDSSMYGERLIIDRNTNWFDVSFNSVFPAGLQLENCFAVIEALTVADNCDFFVRARALGSFAEYVVTRGFDNSGVAVNGCSDVRVPMSPNGVTQFSSAGANAFGVQARYIIRLYGIDIDTTLWNQG